MPHDKLAKLRGVGKSDFYNPTPPIPSFKMLLINNIEMSTILLYSPTCCCLSTSCFHLLPLVTIPSNHSPPLPKKMFPHLVPYQTFFSLESQFAERSREIHLKQPVIDH